MRNILGFMTLMIACVVGLDRVTAAESLKFVECPQLQDACPLTWNLNNQVVREDLELTAEQASQIDAWIKEAEEAAAERRKRLEGAAKQEEGSRERRADVRSGAESPVREDLEA